MHVAKRDGPFLAAGARFAIDWKGAEGIVANFHFHPAFIEEVASSLRLDPRRLHPNPMRPLSLDDPLGIAVSHPDARSGRGVQA